MASFLNNMLYSDPKELATRVASYAAALYGLDKLGLSNLVNSDDRPEILALKVSGLLAGTEYLSDMALERMGFTKPPAFGSDMEQFVKHFASNAIVYYALDKIDIDAMLFKYGTSPEKRALVLGVLFVIMNEISNAVLHRIYRQSIWHNVKYFHIIKKKYIIYRYGYFN
jgi:uncharacterized membrane protein YwzB